MYDYVRLPLIVFFLSFCSSICIFASSPFPDYSGLSDAEVTKMMKSGVVELSIGLSIENLSTYVPKTSTYTRNASDILTPAAVYGIGNLMVLTGSKNLFFATKEKYNRYRESLSKLPQGIMDLCGATISYGAAYYMLSFLNEPFVQLGGQAGCIILYSFLALRGLNLTAVGLKEFLVEMDANKLKELKQKYF